jgi:nucleoside-diphosphate-sugar epimerase
VRLSGRKVLVTGAAGFVGCRLVEKLCLEEGVDVHALVRTWHKATWVSRTSAQLFGGDVTNVSALRTASEGCDIFFHCASGGSDRASYFQTNVEGTRNVMQLARETGARVVFVSTSAVHGPVLPPVLSRNSPYVQTGKAYGESKIAAERLIRESFPDVPCVIIRPTFVWGPRSHLFTTGPLLAMNDGAFRLVDHGDGRCHAVYVDHLVEAILLAASSSEAVGQSFLVTDDYSGFTWRQFFEPLAGLLQRQLILKSVSSTSLFNRMGAWGRVHAEEAIGKLAGNPAPIPRRVFRRSLFELLKLARKFSIPSLWDLQKYSQKSEVDLIETREILRFRPHLSFDAAFDSTARWVFLHLGDVIDLKQKPIPTP